MAVSQELTELIKDQLTNFGLFTVKRMFGGAGLFRQGLMFGLISSSDALFFRTDNENRPDFDAEDLKPLGYDNNSGKRAHMPYHAAPERVLEDAEEMVEWAQKAFEAAIRADNAKPPSKRKYQS